MSGFFTRSALNTTYFDSQSADQKLVHWTVELIFVTQTASLAYGEQFSIFKHCLDPLA